MGGLVSHGCSQVGPHLHTNIILGQVCNEGTDYATAQEQMPGAEAGIPCSLIIFYSSLCSGTFTLSYIPGSIFVIYFKTESKLLTCPGLAYTCSSPASAPQSVGLIGGPYHALLRDSPLY